MTSGDAPYNSEFSLCPMVSCDECGSWTHCQCEGIDEEEYERLALILIPNFIVSIVKLIQRDKRKINEQI